MAEPHDYPRVTPYLLYKDGAAAINWITNVVGFKEKFRFEHGGQVNHAELVYGDNGLVMLGCPSEYRNPAELGGATVLIHLYVDDVDAHHAHAVEQGATVVRELADQSYGDRTYALEDPEGHHWYIAQHVRDVPQEEWT